jgi:hypothetical protein
MAKSVTLSDVPKDGNELEDYVSALFRASKYFVETNITERDFTEILELDAVATSYEANTPTSILAEAKGGDWGFSDIFKVVGWMRYLDLPRGAFFVTAGPRATTIPACQQKVAPLGIVLVDLGDFTDVIARFEVGGFQKVADPSLVDIWRYSAWAERRLIASLRSGAKAKPPKDGPRAAMEYYRLINDGIFFVKEVPDRLLRLYEAYQQHPKLSLGMALEIGGGKYEPDASTTNDPVMHEAIYRGRHNAIQAAFYLEHRARLSILKAGIDLICHAEATGTSPNLPLTLPGTFRAGLEVLRKEPSFKRYALFWQVFLWGFGGFILADRQAEEYGALSVETGVPVKDVPQAMKAFDVLFPTGGSSWIAQLGTSQCIVVKMVPAAFRGIGAYQRLVRHRVTDYAALGYKGFTLKDLASWNNSGVDLLAP